MQISHADSSDRGRHEKTRYAFLLIPPAVIPLSHHIQLHLKLLPHVSPVTLTTMCA
ncbi:hypothetical protein [Sphaerothrix gracilis]|uniref:hypothetical protein n=1 Tax=Sphaerothrix gracilis TaxID=3151835 RepID=UPI0031FDB223